MIHVPTLSRSQVKTACIFTYIFTIFSPGYFRIIYIRDLYSADFQVYKIFTSLRVCSIFPPAPSRYFVFLKSRDGHKFGRLNQCTQRV